MPSQPESGVAALVLAAGASRRLGRPKQLLPYGDGVLLDAVLDTVRSLDFELAVLALGGSGEEVREVVDTSGFVLVDNPAFEAGCSSSIAASLPALGATTEAVVLLLADQPSLRPEAVRRLLAGRGRAAIAVCRYEDGIGHPFAFARSMFGELASLHGDKGVWKLIERHAAEVVEVPVPGTIPLDVDTEADYELILAELEGAR